MPYPIAKLPYGLRCRLNELATPFERYQLQVANGNVLLCPQKLQGYKAYRDIDLFFNNGILTFKYVYYDHPSAIMEDCVMCCESALTLNCANINDLLSESLDNFHLRPKTLCFKNCNITRAFVSKMSTLTTAVLIKSIQITEKESDSKLNFTDIVTFFPRLPSLQMTTPMFPKNVLTEIGLSKTKYLLEIVINCSNILDCLNIDELLTFLKHRPKRFHFYIYVYPENDLVTEHCAKLIKLLDAKLQIGLGDGCVTMGVGDSMHNWCLPSGY